MVRNQRDENLVIQNPGGSDAIRIDGSIFSANGSANVSITNIAPAEVGTATISKWLKFESIDDGLTYYIPCWT